MQKLGIALIALAMGAACSSSKTETQPDEKVVAETETKPEVVAFDYAKTITDVHAQYSSGDLENALSGFTVDSVWEGPGVPTFEGKEPIVAFMTALKGSMPDATVAPRRIFVAADAKISITQGVLKGTNTGPMMNGDPATNKPMSNDFLHIQWWNEEGQVIKTFAISNGTTGMKQFGKMPVGKGENAPASSEWPTEPEVVQWSENAANVDALNAWVAAAAKGDMEAHAAALSDELTGATFGNHELALTKEKSVKWLEGMHKTFSDATVENVYGWSFGDYVVGVYKVSMKNTGDMGGMKATNKDVVLHFADVAKFADGKIVWLESYSNPVELMTQFNPPATAKK